MSMANPGQRRDARTAGGEKEREVVTSVGDVASVWQKSVEEEGAAMDEDGGQRSRRRRSRRERRGWLLMTSQA
jgi:hypothetical protein